MKLQHFFFITALLALCTAAEAKRISVPKVYAFGVAASFTDSIVYFTEIQELDNAWIYSKSHFLQNRDTYSYQLRDYLAFKQQIPHRTCIVFYNENRDKLMKKYQKMKVLYTQTKTGRQQFHVRYINTADFQFQVVDLTEEVAAEAANEQEYEEAKAKMKQEKKAEKKAKKNKKSNKDESDKSGE